ncbi:MAG TPA: DUF456 domain-containing protein [Rubrobacter sp.]|jgi:uncharacterized protein|nr:DUF456 domain-containing protein [Rubrobacter sp.]
MDGVEGPLLALTLVLMFAGLLGSVLPGLPGVTLIFLSALVYAIITDFRTVGVAILVVLFIFAAIAFLADFVATSYGARRFGASNWGTVGGAVGGIAGALIGLLFLGIGSLFGLILGTIAGVFIGEYLRRERQGDQQETEPTQADWRRASRAAGGVLVGYLTAAVIQGLLGLASVVIFVLAVLY